MIAVSSKGRSFRALAMYLVHGRSGEEHDRVAWTASRHLPTDDPELAASIMRATAAQSTRVQKPVYHLALSFDPADQVDPARMEQIADRLLASLGLHDHQVVIVAHQDRAHPHLHLLVNRVHPTTGVAWDFSHDFRQIQASLRAIEQDYGLRVVPGRLASVPDRVVPDRADLTPGEFRQLQRGEAALIERVRSMAPIFREATSWVDLTQQLASQGLRMERKGQGLIVTDGVSTVKASRVARDLSLRGLERRFAVSYSDRDLTAMTPAMTARRDAIRAGYVHSLTAHQYDVELTLQAVRERADRTHWTLHAEAASRDRQIATAFTTVYRNPDRAQAAFQALQATEGLSAAIVTLRDHPEHLGALQTTERITWGGLRTQRDDSPARQHARVTADLLQTASKTSRSFSRRHDDATRDVAVMERRAAQARAALTGLPSLASLERSLSLQASRLLPPELQQLRTWVTAPHRAGLATPTGLVRSLVRGSDERER